MLLLFFFLTGSASPVKDTPFLQDISVKLNASEELNGAAFRKLAINRDGIVYVLTDRGVARLFDNTLALDKSFRPLVGKKPLDVTLSAGELFYLYDDRFLANGWAGKVKASLAAGAFQKFAVAEDGAVLLLGPDACEVFRGGRLRAVQPMPEGPDVRPYAWRTEFFLLASNDVFRLTKGAWELFHAANDATALAFRDDAMFVGTHRGFYALDVTTGREVVPRQTRLPVSDITCLAPAADGVWAGTTRGVFHWSASGGIRYYASKRWLLDDAVLDLALDREGNLFVLTKTGLNKIEFRLMTLAEKAAFYEKKIRQRHIRYGLCSELRLLKPGDITSAEMIDTDNDGSWSAYYMASQALHFGATGDSQAHSNAWETFDALERLESINGLNNGFFARTFERTGSKFSDTDRWRPAPDPDWEWKATTSSDEFTDHTFGYALLWECAAKTPAERQRIAALYTKIIDHIIRNNWYLIDWDGKPTLWARWNPEYVNWFPHSIVDRKLNSVEIIAGLQFAYKITGKELYREKAFELLYQHGYLGNIVSSMKLIAPTKGFIHQGNDMGDEWNHSDDQLAFDTYWVLHRFAFNNDLKKKYAAAVRDHFELEKHERIPIWNFVTAMTGGKDFDMDGALWTLRRFPLDLISWSVQNSHRGDITKLPLNFRSQEMAELLPPGERRMSRWNGHPFVLDGGDGGRIEFAGDEFLLPYWMGRYLKLIR